MKDKKKAVVYIRVGKQEQIDGYPKIEVVDPVTKPFDHESTKRMTKQEIKEKYDKDL